MSLLFPQQEKLGQRQLDFYKRSRPDVLSLALLAAPARKIESELLRCLRLELSNYFPFDKTPTVGTESALWFSSLVESRGADSITLLPGVLDLLRRQLKEQHSGLLEKIRPIILECHESIPPIIRWEEDLVYYSLSSVENSETLRETILSAAKTILIDERKGLEEWVNKMCVRVPAELFNHDDFKNLLSLSQAKLVRPKVLTDSTETTSASAERILQIKKGESEIAIGTSLADADYQIGVPKTIPTTVIIWSSSNPEIKQSYVIPPEGEIPVTFTPDDDTLFLQTTDGRIYQIPYDESAISDKRLPEPEKSLSRPLNEARMLVVGNAGAGKTSLITRLVENSFNPSGTTTHGLRITPWNLQLNGENIRLNIWDFGGQEIMHGISQFFFTRRSLYLLVLDARLPNIKEQVDFWLGLIQTFGGDSSVILVLNKINTIPSDPKSILPPDRYILALLEKYPIIKEFVRTDMAAGTGVSELREIIKREVSGINSFRELIPSDWFAVKEALADLSGNYITIERYWKLCEEFGISDKDSQDAVAGLLHNLGYILNFKDDEDLSRIIISNPEWLTNGIYRILNSEIVISRQGEIHLSDLPEILPESEYPRDIHRFLMEVMRKFEICFNLPDDSNHYLIPELLSAFPPPEADEFDLKECLNFEYHYEVLPSNLITRFMVHYTEGNPRWRNGLILEYVDSRALVKGDTAEKKVLISIKGDINSQRNILAIIRKEFSEIHNTYNDLKVEEMVPLPEYPDTAVSYNKLIRLEEDGQLTFTEFIDNRVIEVDVQELLNGISADPQRTRTDKTSDQKILVYCSYSRIDEKLYDEFRKYLDLSRSVHLTYLNEFWDNREMPAGVAWEEEIRKNLENADVFLLFISPEYLSSEWCEREMKIALEQYERKGTRIVPILLSPANWEDLPISRFQALPGKAIPIPVTGWKDKNKAWLEVSLGIGQIIQSIIFERESQLNESEFDDYPL